MQSLRLLSVATFLSLILVPRATLAVDPLPDNLDVTKYQGIYLNAKSKSDDLRSNANSWHSHASSIDARIDAIESQIATQTRNIQQHHNSIAHYNDEIRNSRSQIFSLESEIKRLSDLIQINNSSWATLQRDENALNDRLGYLGREWEQVNRRAEHLKAKIRDIHQDIRALEGQVAQKREAAKNLQQSSQQKDRESDQSEAKAREQQQKLSKEQGDLNQLNSALIGAEAQSAQAAQDLQNEKAKAGPLRDALQAARQVLANKQNEIAPLRAAVQKSERELRQLEQQVGRKKSEIAAISDRLSAKEAELAKLKAEPSTPEIEAKIAAVQAEITQIEGQKSQASSELSALEGKVSAEQSELASAKSALQNAESQLGSFEADVAAKKSAADAQEAVIQRAQAVAQASTQGVQKIRGDIAQSQKEIAQLQRSIPELQSAAQNLKQQANQERAQAATLANEAKTLDDQADDKKKVAQRLMQEKGEVDRDLNRLENAIADVRSRLIPVQAEMRRLQLESERYSAIIQSSQNQIVENQRLIQDREVRIDQLEGQIASLEQSNRDLTRELASRREESATAWANYRDADSRARDAEAITAQHRQQYVAVKARFDALMTEATNLGASQGAPLGSKDGTAQGQLDGTAVGKQEGEIKGTADGLQYGFDLGTQQGAATGKTEGYAHGKNLPQNYEDGRVQGVAQGEKDALASAAANEYPAARAAVRQAKFAKPPVNAVTVDNKAVAENAKKSASEIALGSRDAEMARKAIAFLENQGKEVNSNSLNGGMLVGVDSKSMSQAEFANVIEIAQVVGRSERNFETIFARMEVNMGAGKCEQQYEVFIQGCLNAYRSAYTQSYQSDYTATHATAKAAAYKLNYDLKFEANKMVRYKEAYDPAYAAAYTQWDTIGANEARAQGYKDGKKAGFDGKIAQARKDATAQGTKDEEELFASQAVIGLLDATITKPKSGIFTAGDAFSLQVKFANYGGQGTKRGDVKVSWESLSQDIATEDAVSQIVSLASNTTTTVKSVAFAKVGISAGEQETHKIRVRAIMPDGSKQEKIVSLTSRLLITPTVSKSYDANPDVSNLFVYHSHQIKVTIKNPTTETALKDLSVVLSTTKASDVKFKVAAGNVGRLRGGAAAAINFEYKFTNEKVIGKPFPFTLKYYYGNELVNTENFNVNPVK